MLRVRLAIALVVTAHLGACDPDQGKPTETIFVQDAGNDAAPVDAAPGGLKKNGDICMTSADCESGMCFVGGKESFCTIPCTTANAVTVCAAAPFIGVCNMQGFCKIN
ncbi:MAG TPA: hypothetical protein VIF62_33195 [Labilithrix sp.]|jgi:hypothetical protein